MSSSEYANNGKRRHAGMFKPGVSGNPKGRPKKAYRMAELARMYIPEVIPILADIATNPKTKTADQIRAINILFDRAYGKA